MDSRKVKNRELVSFNLYAFVFLTIGLFALIVYYLVFRHFKASISELAIFMISSSIIIILLLLFCNSWSIWVANKMGELFNPYDIEESEQGICDYCGESSPRFICNGCKSILWYRIPPFLGKLGVFFAHHRWKITAGILWLFFIGPLAFSYGLMSKKAGQIKESEVDSRNLLTSLTKGRALIFEIELLVNDSCKNSYPTSEKLYRDFVGEQFNISWSAPRIVGFLGESKCKNSDIKTNGIDTSKNSLEIACDLIMYESQIDSLDILFVEYMKISKLFHEKGEGFSKKKEIAGKYNLIGRELGCIIGELGLGLAQDLNHPITEKFSCKEVFKRRENYEEKIGIIKLWEDVENHNCISD